MSATIEKTLGRPLVKKIDDGRYAVEAQNNDHTSFESVFNVLVRAAKHPKDMAYKLTAAIHENGKAIVFHGSEGECLLLRKALKNIFVVSQLVEWKW